MSSIRITCTCGHTDNWQYFALGRLPEKARQKIAYQSGGDPDMVDRHPRWRCPDCGTEWQTGHGWLRITKEAAVA